jgi:hypothetical protein
MAAELNITNILYTSYRLSPFILVSFFILSSLLNQDFKGLIYLAGLLFACFLSAVVGKFNTFNMSESSEIVCNTLTLTTSEPFSKLPLSMTIFTYTFGYLLYIIIYNSLAIDNIFTIILFSLLIIVDWTWNITFNCNNHMRLFASFLIGAGVGVGWSAVIVSTNQVALQYFNGLSNKEVCSINKKVKFRCITKTK